jgi:5-deoxy-glucuronate isomerase
MRQYDATNLIVHPGNSAEPGVVVEVTPEQAGWDFIHFQVRRLQPGQSWSVATGEHELALVILSGTLNVASNMGDWQGIGERANVFAGLPSALYLPRRTTFTATTSDACEFAAAWVAADQDYAPLLITPSDIAIEIRGGDHATRQINSILPPGFACQRLVVVEVYTPGGNWSSYPPHKHDVHKTDVAGNIVEADLEEVYYYKLDRPEGYALQRVYTDPESPLQRAGAPIDAVLLARENDVVLVPEGYHPVSSPPGYTTYYLNVLAGSAQSLANSEDPRYAWVKDTYRGRDERVPIYWGVRSQESE